MTTTRQTTTQEPCGAGPRLEPGPVGDCQPANAADTPAPDLLTIAQTHYANQLASHEPARTYLTERCGIPPDTFERYSIGWADGALHTHLTDELDLDPEHCIAAGLIQRDEDGALRDVLDGHIVVPDIVDGQVVHLAARPLNDEQPAGWHGYGAWRPGWLHVPGSPARCYNEDAYEQLECIIVETPLHAIALREWGHPAL
ncbi:MAG: hypothetical protein PVH68_19720, partial [Armatimonadota bacterium]